MAKLSEKAKVEALEHAVVYGTLSDLQQLLTTYKTFDFSARALGLACLYGDLDKVKALVERGIDFTYDDTPSMRSRYGTVYRSKTAEYYSYYHLLPLYRGQRAYIPLLDASVCRYHFGAFEPLDRPMVSDEQRRPIVAYLCTQPNLFFKGPELVYYATLWDDHDVLPLLREHREPLSEAQIDALTDTGQSMLKSELWVTLMSTPAEAVVRIMAAFNQQLEALGQSMLMPEYVLQQADEAWLRHLWEQGALCLDLAGAKKSAMLKFAIENQRLSLLDLLLKCGYAAHPTSLQKALTCAQECGNVSATAMLLDYQHHAKKSLL